MGKKAKKKSKRKHPSIIDHTITCAYCGHRILPKNEERHMRQQHGENYEMEKLVKELTKNKTLTNCPHCGIIMKLYELEEHIRQSHADIVQQIDKRLSKNEQIAIREHQRHRMRVAKSFNAKLETDNARDPDAPWEWRLAESHERTKARKSARSLPKPITKLPMKSISTSKPSQEHFKLASQSTQKRSKPKTTSQIVKLVETDAAQPLQLPPEIEFICPTCGVKLKSKIRLIHHRKRVHPSNTDT